MGDGFEEGIVAEEDVLGDGISIDRHAEGSADRGRGEVFVLRVEEDPKGAGDRVGEELFFGFEVLYLLGGERTEGNADPIEFFFLIEGVGSFWVLDDGDVDLSEGDFAFVPEVGIGFEAEEGIFFPFGEHEGAVEGFDRSVGGILQRSGEGLGKQFEEVGRWAPELDEERLAIDGFDAESVKGKAPFFYFSAVFDHVEKVGPRAGRLRREGFFPSGFVLKGCDRGSVGPVVFAQLEGVGEAAR